MPLQKIQLRPGLNREGTNYANEGGWFDGDKIRFRSGYPEKIGGWTRYSNNTYLGTCRALWTWADQNGQGNYIGVGTTYKYYISEGGYYYDVTPIYHTSTLTNAITATNGSSYITITDGNYSPNVGDFILISGATSLGGNITATVLNQEFQVTSVLTSTQYQVNVGVTANTLDTGNGGAITVQYEYPIGLDVYTTGNGWGAGPWGGGTTEGWGQSAAVGIGEQLRLWSNDNFGADLVIAPRGGQIAYWADSAGVNARAILLSTLATSSGYQGAYVPSQTNQVLVSPIQQFLVALGSNSYIPGTPTSPFNPMLVRWSDQANPYQWVPAVTNQSGEFQLSNGSIIMGGVATRVENLIWTDSALYSMQYVGFPYIWSFNILMDNISIIAPKAMITVNNVTYWMGRDKFYMYTGTVQTLPCSVRQYIFDDINTAQAYQIFAAANEAYNEVWWFYVSQSGDGTVINKYVMYNYLDRVWAYGSLTRTAWIDSGIQPYPIAAYNNLLLYHENGVDDVSGLTPVPISAYVQSSDFDIGSGDRFSFVWRMLPDVTFMGSTVNNPSVTMTLYPRQNSGSAYGTGYSNNVISGNNYTQAPEYTIEQFTGQVYTRVRGRQLSIKVSSNTLGSNWQLGVPRLDLKPDGRR